MKNKEIQEKSRAELEKILSEKQTELVQLRFDVRAGQQKNFTKIGLTKKVIARIKNRLNNVDTEKEDKLDKKDKLNNNQDHGQRDQK